MKGTRVYLRGIFKVPHPDASPGKERTPGESCNKSDSKKTKHEWGRAQSPRKAGKKISGGSVKDNGNAIPRMLPSATWSGQWGMDPSHFDQRDERLTSGFSYSCHVPFLAGVRATCKAVRVKAPNSTKIDDKNEAGHLTTSFGKWMRIQGSFDVRGAGGVVTKVIREQSASMCIDSNAQCFSHHESQAPSGVCGSCTVHGVQGFGRNEFGQFTLAGTFNSTTGELDVVKEYQGPDFCPSGRSLHLGELYSLVQKSTGCLGGNGAGGAIYGEVTRHSFQRIVDTMKLHTGFCAQSTFIDIGSGLGKPNLHVAVDPGVGLSYGIELIGERWLLSLANLRDVLRHGAWSVARRTFFSHADAVLLATLEPFTHVYTFDEGFPPPARARVVALFNTSAHACCLCSFSKSLVEDHALDAEKIAAISISMVGSGERKTCFIYFRSRERSAKWRASPKNRNTSVRCRDNGQGLGLRVATRRGCVVKSTTDTQAGDRAAASQPGIPEAVILRHLKLSASLLGPPQRTEEIIKHTDSYKKGHAVFQSQTPAAYLMWLRVQLANQESHTRKRTAPAFHEDRAPASKKIELERKRTAIQASESADAKQPFPR